MAQTTFSLLVLNDNVKEEAFVSAVRDLPRSDRPLFVGKCQHWIHAPHLSAAALAGNGNTLQKWDFLIVNKATLPKTVSSLAEKTWSITAPVDDNQLANYSEAQRTRLSTSAPPLPDGWSPKDHSGLDAAVPPPDLELSLALSSFSLGSSTDDGQKPVLLTEFVRDFGVQYTGAVSMFNLLSYLPDGRPRYFEYVAAFTASVGSKYGGDAMFHGLGVSDWSSKADDVRLDPNAFWYDTALIHYPSIWHFGKLLDDPDYMDVDRRFKQGVLRDNPIMCCTEIDV